MVARERQATIAQASGALPRKGYAVRGGLRYNLTELRLRRRRY